MNILAKNENDGEKRIFLPKKIKLWPTIDLKKTRLPGKRH